ncbi:MAG: energy transducer TonB [Bacteroidales bacterium]|nr:energy transducer TonB [Bacteroidales bacterium]
MQQFLRERKSTENNATLTGVVLSVIIHCLLMLSLTLGGMSYLYPPPAETTFLLDFTEDPEDKPEIPKVAKKIEPRADEADKTKPVELVRKENINDGKVGANSNPAPTGNDFGDVETPAQPAEPEPEETFDPRSLYPGHSQKDHSAGQDDPKKEEDGGKHNEGNPNGNAPVGKMEGVPNAHLEGRTKVHLPAPQFNEQESGTVIVTITVDQYGNVTDAQCGAPGTTTSNPRLWAAARKAALESKFNMKANAPVKQTGTITYVFTLK